MAAQPLPRLRTRKGRGPVMDLFIGRSAAGRAQHTGQAPNCCPVGADLAIGQYPRIGTQGTDRAQTPNNPPVARS